jgi:glycosyltransferase involved in cell wall biosynthesis
LLPNTPAMALGRAALLRTISSLEAQEDVDSDGAVTLALSLPLASALRPKESGPVGGDVVVSVGLDWDQSYSVEFFNLHKKTGLRLITCCYDLIPLLYPQNCVADVARRFKEYFTQVIWSSAGIICISEQSKRDLSVFCASVGAPERPMRVVRLGDTVPHKDGEISDSVQELSGAPFILFVSTIERRKNHEVLYRAYHHLCATGHRHKLPKMVFVGMHGWGVDELMKDIELDPLTQGLFTRLNHVADAELNYLYEQASFCVYPSLYEGWGLPVAEALVYGKAILCSNRGSLPEVGGKLVKYLQPWDTYGWAAALLEFIENPAKVRALEQDVRAHYVHRAWSGTARATLDLINEVIKEDNARPITILPGYECLTLAGTHLGPNLRSNGQPGHMLYGPYRALAPGAYEIQIYDTLAQRHPSTLLFDVVHGIEMETLAARHLKTSDVGIELGAPGTAVAAKAELAETPLMTLSFKITQAISDYQIRCYLFEGGIELRKIVIQRM